MKEHIRELEYKNKETNDTLKERTKKL